MGSALPIIVVFPLGTPPQVEEVLDAAGIIHRPGSPQDAAEAVNGGWAEVVVCTRHPGWEALVGRVAMAGGAAVLLGGSPTPAERHRLGLEIDCAQTPTQLVEAIIRAHGRALKRRTLDGDSLAERELSAELVGRFAQSIALQIGLPQMSKEAVARTRDLVDADGASLLLVDPLTGRLAFDEGAGLETARLVAEYAARRGEPLRVERVPGSTWFDSAVDAASGFCTGSVVAVPLLLGGDVLGVLVAIRGADREPFFDAHLRRLKELAPHVTVAVYNAQITARLREAQAQVLRDNADLERRIAERTAMIGRAKREWELTFDAIDEPIAVQHGFILRRANVAYARHAGVKVTEIPGSTCYELLAGRSSPCPGCPLTKPGSAELAGEVTARGETTFRLSGFHLKEEPHARGVVLHYRDVTRQKVLEDRLRESERLAALGQLASGAAHEINNPLGFLVSNLRNLMDNVRDLAKVAEAVRRALPLLKTRGVASAVQVLEEVAEEDTASLATESEEMISESLDGARRVGEIVRGLRELSRQQVSQAGAADVNAAVTRAVRAEFGDHAAPVLDLRAHFCAAVDPLQLDQALGHLLRNARQATNGSERIFLRTEVVRGEVVIEVRDEGSGIAPEHVNRVFEPFFTTRGVGAGIGLGLTATWGIVHRHGGRIEVTSQRAQGTTFTVFLPVAEETAPVIVSAG